MSEPAAEFPDPIANGSVAQAPLRVFNRSDRVWIFGYVRMIPFVLFVGGIFGMVLLHWAVGDLPLAVAIPLGLFVIVVPFVLDRLPALNPVNYIWIADDLQVIRAAGRKRAYAPEHILAVEFAPREGEDYDDRDKNKRMTEVTFRLRHAWPVHLLAAHESAVAIAVWARTRGLPISEPPTRSERGEHVSD
ncbi:MAG TPA: hypothetical protein VHR66_16930 [Gemmataceae bacterium]|nr:hypothetical protein [Gemmataceae bacterium]